MPGRISDTGKRSRHFFETKQAAENYCEGWRTSLKNFGTKGTSILSPATQEQAVNAMEILKPYGVTLNEVVQDYVSRRKAAAASIPFEKAMDLFMEHPERTRSESYTRSIRQTKNRLTSLHGKLLNEITAPDLRKSTAGMTASVRNFSRRILGGVFSYGQKHGYCTENPASKLDLAEHDRAEIEVYSPESVAAILHATEKHDRELVPFQAISFYAGIRLSEMLRLDWRFIDLQENFIKLPAKITKTKGGRNIDISPTLAAWLQPFAQESGLVVPWSREILRNRMASLREHHGIQTIKHGQRHCFASYWLALNPDSIGQLCLYLGHTDSKTTMQHYAKAATRRDAEKFMAILPKIKGGKVVEFQKEAA